MITTYNPEALKKVTLIAIELLEYDGLTADFLYEVAADELGMERQVFDKCINTMSSVGVIKYEPGGRIIPDKMFPLIKEALA